MAEASFDTEDLVERLMGNEDLARRLAGAFVDRMPEQLAALAQAISNSDAEATMFAAHTIKGVAGNVGCGDVQQLASRLEKFGESGDFALASDALPKVTAAFEAVRPALRRFCSGG